MQKFFKFALALNLLPVADRAAGIVWSSGDGGNSDPNNDGFNSVYKWRDINDAFKEARKTRKPIFLLIHKPWCPACKKLKTKFSKSMKLIDLSKNFIMVNVENTADVVDRNRKFYPDGKYVPRILFFDPDGKLIGEAYNRSLPADSGNRYFYSTPGSIIDTMLLVLNMDFRKAISGFVKFTNDPKMMQPISGNPSSDKPTLSDEQN